MKKVKLFLAAFTIKKEGIVARVIVSIALLEKLLKLVN
jgi:hypothetical protein